MHTFTVRIPDDLYEALRLRAFEHRCSQQSVITGALRHFFRHFLSGYQTDGQPEPSAPAIDAISLENGVRGAMLGYLREMEFQPDDSIERATLDYLREMGSATS